MVTDGNGANAVGQDSVKEVVRKAFQVCPAQVPQVRMEAQWICGRDRYVFVKFSPELIPKPTGELVVATQNAIDVLLDSGVIADLHRPRSDSTRRINSW